MFLRLRGSAWLCPRRLTRELGANPKWPPLLCAWSWASVAKAGHWRNLWEGRACYHPHYQHVQGERCSAGVSPGSVPRPSPSPPRRARSAGKPALWSSASAVLHDSYPEITLSMGAAAAKDGITFATLYNAADRQPYEAKRAGRNCFRCSFEQPRFSCCSPRFLWRWKSSRNIAHLSGAYNFSERQGVNCALSCETAYWRDEIDKNATNEN